jgi:hypothetical protein
MVFLHDKSLHYSFLMREENVAAKLLTLLVPPDFGGASEKCQGEF